MKYLRYKKDGYVVAWNANTALNTEQYEEFETDGNPQPPEWSGELPQPVDKKPDPVFMETADEKVKLK